MASTSSFIHTPSVQLTNKPVILNEQKSENQQEQQQQQQQQIQQIQQIPNVRFPKLQPRASLNKQVNTNLNPPSIAAPLSETTIVLFRDNDLRLHDNEALDKACRLGYVVPVILINEDDKQRKQCKTLRNFYISSILDLQNKLKKKGSELYIRYSLNEIIELYKQTSATRLHLHYSTNKKIDNFIITGLKQNQHSLSVNLHCFWTGYLRNPNDLPFHLNQLPQDCDEFNKLVSNIQIKQPLNEPDQIVLPPTSSYLTNISVGQLNFDQQMNYHGGESIGLNKVDDYINGKSLASIDKFNQINVNPATIDTKIGRLNPFLTFGCISPKRFWFDVVNNISEFNVRRFCTEFELILRDFVSMITLKHGTYPI